VWQLKETKARGGTANQNKNEENEGGTGHQAIFARPGASSIFEPRTFIEEVSKSWENGSTLNVFV
jgi:hypothetical protein